MEMLACPNLAVSPEVMQHIVQVESGANPFAIGVVDGQLVRQPKNMDEAVATAQMLESKGYNFSLGIAQVNRSNLGRYGLDSYRKAFGACDNLAAGAQILARCYGSAHGDWGKAFSCYYSGNFTTGFRDGYVQKVYASINREAAKNGPAVARDAPDHLAIPLIASTSTPGQAQADANSAMRPVVVYASDSAQYRVALRSMAIDTAAAAMLPLVVSDASHSPHAQGSVPADAMAPHPSGNVTDQAAPQVPSGPGAQQPVPPNAGAPHVIATGIPLVSDEGVFEPMVRGPNDPPSPSPTVAQEPAKRALDRADLRKGVGDDAFVF